MSDPFLRRNPRYVSPYTTAQMSAAGGEWLAACLAYAGQGTLATPIAHLSTETLERMTHYHNTMGFDEHDPESARIVVGLMNDELRKRAANDA